MSVRQIESPNPVPCAKEFSLTKTSEDAIQLILGNTTAGVGHIEIKFIVLPFIAKSDTALASELNSICDEVDN